MITHEQAFKIIEKYFVGLFKECSSIEERYRLMQGLFPESDLWGAMESRWLIYRLQREHRIDFGVCAYYSFEDGKQFCSLTSTKVECLCVIPQKYCVPRDRHKDSRKELACLESQEF